MSIQQNPDVHLSIVRPVVLNLLRQAHEHYHNAEGNHAEAYYRAAITADMSPLASIEYGAFLSLQGRQQEALTLLTSAWETAKLVGSPLFRSQACHNLAAVHRALHHPEQAFQFQQLAISAELDACEAGEVSGISEESRLGQALDDLTNNQRYQAKDSLQLLEKSSTDAETRVVCHLNLGQIAMLNNLTSQALSHAQTAFSIAKQARIAPAILNSLELLIGILVQTGHWKQAEHCLDQACVIAENLETEQTSHHLANKRKKLKNAIGFLNANPSLN